MEFQDDELEEILNIFRAEAEEIIGRLNNVLLELEKNPSNKDYIVLLFRDAHSLKGASRMIGFNAVQNLAHKMEDTLGLAKEDKLTITSQIADTLYKTVDTISRIIEQSISTGKENYDENEVQNLINNLENIQNNEIAVVIEEETPDETETENIQYNQNGEYDKKLFIQYSEDVFYLLVNTLIYVIKLTENIEKDSIIKVLENSNKLLEIFNQIGDFEIKNNLENISLKLNVITRCNSELMPSEVDEIQQELDKIINRLSLLCDYENIKTIDFYGYAFDGKDYIKAPAKNQEEDIEETLEETITSTEIVPEKSIELNFDIEKIINDIKSLQKSGDAYDSLIEKFEYINSIENNGKFKQISENILDLIRYTKNINAVIDDGIIEILLNSTRFCFAYINGNKPSEDVNLIAQQLTVAKQLVEISNPTSIQKTEIIPAQSPIDLKTNNINTNKKVKDFTKLFDTGEIKTLHVESSKLDAMVNQIGELIASKIKTTKQLSELKNLNSKLEDLQKDFGKSLRHMKSYEKRFLKTSKDTDGSFSLFTKQILNTLTEHNSKLSTIMSDITQLQRTHIEDDMHLRLLIDDFDAMIKNIRVLPLATVFHLFGRMIRDIAKERGKEVELTILGSETSADKKIIEEIKNPLIHIIRNSIDHGIETPERRKELGKSPIGHIEINAKHLDNKILIEVKDDGQGFNIEKIKEKAVSKGFLTQEEISGMSEEDIINLVFWPGFTTGDEVTSISGRGVGMDVVKSKIAQLNGTVKVISDFNKGSCIQIELPVTMATLTAFLIQTSNQTFAIPMSVINTVVCRKDDEIYNNHETLTILHNKKNIPVYSLANLLNLPDTNTNTQKTIIIIETNNKTLGIIVDKLVGEQEILHKKLSPPLYRLKNISGITTLATGETCLILNTIDLIKNATLQSSNKINMKSKMLLQDKKSIFAYKRILIVDDSITTRTLEKNILTNAGFNVNTAVDPIEALNLINEQTFDLIITDVEMPNMTGLELLANLKSNELYNDIPVIVMSSLADKNTKRKAYSLGAKNFLVKGEFNQKAFIDIISEIILENQN